MNDRVSIRIEDGIAYVALTRADKHNGVDLAMLRGIAAAQKQLRKRRELRAVILHGEGPSFCAGLDFKSVMGKPVRALPLALTLWLPMRNIFQMWSLGWRELGVPVIAAVHGNCFGAGIQLALGADIRYARPDARISIMEAKWGLIPDMGGAVLLRELLPIDLAKELTFTGRILSGNEAHALGLVTHLADDPLAAAVQLAQEIATRSPDAVAAGKFLLQDAWAASDRGASNAERRWQRRLLGWKNQRIAMQRNQGKPELPFADRRL